MQSQLALRDKPFFLMAICDGIDEKGWNKWEAVDWVRVKLVFMIQWERVHDSWVLLSFLSNLFLEYLHDFGCPLGHTYKNMYMYILASWQSLLLQIYLSLYIEENADHRIAGKWNKIARKF